MVCQRCRSLWSTCTSNALPHRWRNRYLPQGQGKRSLGVGVLFRDHVPGSGALRFFCGRPGVFCVLPSFGRATIVSPPCRVQSCFGRLSCHPSTRRRSRDALPAKGCTCRSCWSQRAFKHCLVALYRDRRIGSSKDACLFLLKRPAAPGMLESNVVCQLEPSVNETDAVVFYHGTTILEGLSSIYSSPLLHLQLPVSP